MSCFCVKCLFWVRELVMMIVIMVNSLVVMRVVVGKGILGVICGVMI